MTQIALNRPQVMNALNRTMRAEITAAWEAEQAQQSAQHAGEEPGPGTG